MHTHTITNIDPDFANHLIAEIKENKLKIPTQPEVAVRLRECAENPNITIDQLAQVISHDPALTARFIQIANSPLMRGQSQINSLPNVISRLGIRFVCNIATGLAMEQIFQATDSTVDKLLRDVWGASTHVAAYAHVIAKLTNVPVESASLAGLMHQIGALPILSYAQDHDELLEDPEQLLTLLDEHHPKISEFILKSWKFPDEISSLPVQLRNLTTAPEKPELAHVVQASILKTHETNKHYLKIHTNDMDAKKLLCLESDDFLTNETFQSSLDDTLKFYCHLN
ncbi:HDOD domain-containing protein [Candidatus Berkiella aquae]|uniref:HDOD domain protein n=1 Tax=Candidatus Berkiella aquae TaxID=295108 RepID=A0A0Q9YS97_9GAMM|nr:HDOD domain-containing protein [Candidatus Berkiella aquae]MCS5710186.1 HDOD domain-containing protein [Candidatus Berkiella aquae]